MKRLLILSAIVFLTGWAAALALRRFHGQRLGASSQLGQDTRHLHGLHSFGYWRPGRLAGVLADERGPGWSVCLHQVIQPCEQAVQNASLLGLLPAWRGLGWPDGQAICHGRCQRLADGSFVAAQQPAQARQLRPGGREQAGGSLVLAGGGWWLVCCSGFHDKGYCWCGAGRARAGAANTAAGTCAQAGPLPKTWRSICARLSMQRCAYLLVMARVL